MEFIYTHLALTDEADLITCKLERSSSSGSDFVVKRFLLKTDDDQAVDALEYADRGVEQALEILCTLKVAREQINLGGSDERALHESDRFFFQELSQILVDFIYGAGKITMECTPNPQLATNTTGTKTTTSATKDKKKPSKPANKSKEAKKKNKKK